MISGQKRQYIFGAAVTVAVVISIISIFTMLSRTNLKDITMDPGEKTDWSYELISGSEARPAVPEIVDEYTVSFPGESCRAVRARRTLNETLDGAQLGIYLYDAVSGVDILLDGEMFYTSFENAPRDGAGFVIADGMKPVLSEKSEIRLPEDCLGKEITVVTYFPAETTEIIPVFPYICSVDTVFAITSVENVPPIFRTTLCAIFALLTALVYFLDVSNGKADKKVLLLTLFYSMLTLKEAFMSLAGSYSIFSEKLNMLDFVCELYMAPLVMFAAFCLTSWRRWVLAAATGLWFVYDCIKLIRFRIMYGPFFGKATAAVVLVLYLLAAVLIIIEIKKKKEKPSRKTYIIYAGIAAVAAVMNIIMFSAEWNGNVVIYLQQILIEPLRGDYYMLMRFVTNVCAVTVTAAAVMEFVKRTFRTRELINALTAQNRRAMDSYNRMAESEELTYSLRHEMRHHMIALSGMLNDGATDRAREYAATLTEEYNDLPDSRYSKNAMVNIIAGTYLGRAKAQGIEVKHSLNLPETLPIADMDLCVFLTNMFENALHACEKAPSNRYIRVKMYINGSYLFIGCSNSLPKAEPEAKKDRFHGYGLENMKRIAEKYGGIVKIDKNESSFSLKSSFYLKDFDV